jgi:hypothetical protein
MKKSSKMKDKCKVKNFNGFAKHMMNSIQNAEVSNPTFSDLDEIWPRR